MTHANASVEFFEQQFRRQIDGHDYTLNPFETAVLPFLQGSLLDLGCGLGNLSVAAARAGAHVTALDACPSAIADLSRRAGEMGLAIEATCVDLATWRPARTWDAVACIGLLMFFAPARARAGLAAVRDAVRPGGIAAVNVLVEGTTYLDMFDPEDHCLFPRGDLARSFEGWEVLLARDDEFPAPGGRLKRFETVTARRPS